MSVYQFNFPTPIRFGDGAIAELPAAIANFGWQRPLLVTDQGIKDLPFFKQIEQSLTANSINFKTYADFSGNPIHDHVVKGRDAFRGHDADSIVIVGGGAALDVGKAIALVAYNEGDLFEYEISLESPREVTKPLPPMIAIPTTAGTGSEVGRASVISENDTHEKKILLHAKMLPGLVIADPAITLGLPQHVTAATGFDALTHNIEAFLSVGYHPLCDGIALEGIHMVAEHLPTACAQPENLAARSAMLAASLMGAVAFQKGLGVTHSCAHALSTVHDMHHGLANALMLKSCMEFNGEQEQARVARIARAAGIWERDDAKACQDFYQWIPATMKTCGLTPGLKNHGVEVSDRLVEVAFADFCHQENPRPVSKDDFKALYAAAM